MQAFLLVVSLVLLLLGIVGVFAWGSPLSRKYKIGLGLGIWMVLLFSVLYFIADSFTGEGFNEGVTYHLIYGFTDLDSEIFLHSVLLGVLGILLTLGGSLWIVFRKKIAPSKKCILVASFVLLAFFLHPTTHYLSQLSLQSVETQSSIDPNSTFYDYYQYPEVTQNGEKKNLVVLYLESLERTYFDEARFPGLTPKLKELEAKSVSFTNLYQVPGTGFTLGGMVGSQCGIPPIAPSHANHMGSMESYLPAARCLGDILSDNGYSLSYMGGANLGFAGKGNFYRTHGFDEVRGLQSLKQELEKPKYTHSWGLYDDFLLDKVYERFLVLSKAKRPFGLFSLTLDTHVPGFHSKSCRTNGIQYQDGTSKILNALHCSDHLVAQFVEKIRNSEYSDDTIVVVVTDHYAMRNTTSSLLKQGGRSPLFLINFPDRSSENNLNEGSLLDFSSTVLPLIGFEGNVGLGRNLLTQEAPQATERQNFIRSNIKHWRQELMSFWAFPKLKDAFTIDAKKQKIWMDKTALSIPVLLQFTEDFSTRPVFQFHPFRNKTLFSPNHPTETPQIYIDYCHNTNLMVYTDFVEGGEGSLCILSRYYHRLLEPKSKVTKAEVLEMTTPSEAHPQSILIDANFDERVLTTTPKNLQENPDIIARFEQGYANGIRTFSLPVIYDTETQQLTCRGSECDLEAVFEWFGNQSDHSYLIISDVNALQFIAREHPEIVPHIIARIEDPQVYGTIKSLRYGKVIWKADGFVREMKARNINPYHAFQILDLMQGSLAMSLTEKSLDPASLTWIRERATPIYVSDAKNPKKMKDIRKKYKLRHFFVSPLP